MMADTFVQWNEGRLRARRCIGIGEQACRYLIKRIAWLDD